MENDFVFDGDVLVAGGGPAGFCAALAAARQGASVAVIDMHGCLGGVWTAGLLCWIIDAGNKPGITAELSQQLDQRGARRARFPGAGSFAYDPEIMKLLLEELAVEAGMKIQYFTQLISAHVIGRNIDHICTQSKSGLQRWRAKTFIDCTGDGDLGAFAKCSYSIGHPETGKCQPLSMCTVLGGIRGEEVQDFICGGVSEPKQRLLAAIRAGGHEPSYQPPVMMQIHDDLFNMIPHHAYGVACDDAAAITAASIQGRKEVHQTVAALRSLGGPWKDLRVVATAEQIGIREGRRIHGRAAISKDDLVNGFHPNDSIATCCFNFDVHSTDDKVTKGFQHPPESAKPYGIPLASLIAKDRDNLLMAGRCISGDFYAHSSYRVTGDSTIMGEAAGICAALSVRDCCDPADIPWARFDPVFQEALGLHALT